VTAAGQPQVRAQDAQVGLAFMSKVCRQQKCLSCILCSYCAHAYTSSYQVTRYLRRLPCCCTSEEGQLDLAEKIFERAARYTRVLQSQLTILPGLHKDSEMDGTVVHNLDTEQTVS